MKLSTLEKESLYQLSNLAEEYGYDVTQENGQRVFGPPNSWEHEKPSYQCEVFISKYMFDFILKFKRISHETEVVCLGISELLYTLENPY